MKKTFLFLLLMSNLLSVSAQEADRTVGDQHISFQTACHPQDVKGYDTKTLRERFVMEKVMEADKINLTYSHYQPLRSFHLRWRYAGEQDPEAGELLGAGTRCR